MSNIEVGEYVRTVDGFIRKIDNINTVPRDITYYGKYILDIPYKNSQSVAKSKIIKHSKNIIDLIEMGDYVNGFKVIGISNISGWVDTPEDVIYKDHIKSIVTREMFKEMEYRIDE